MIEKDKLCEMLNLHKKQKRMCRRGTGIAEALLEAIRISVIECHYQFRYERWNCSLADPYRQKILQKGRLFILQIWLNFHWYRLANDRLIFWRGQVDFENQYSGLARVANLKCKWKHCIKQEENEYSATLKNGNNCVFKC